MTNNPGWRFTIVGVVFASLGVVIIGQLVRIKILPQADQILAQSGQYAGVIRMITPPRGQIFDRWGNLLAGNKTVYEIGVELKHVTNPETIALALSIIIGIDYDHVLTLASQPYSEDAVYALLADFISAEQVAQLQSYTEQLDSYQETGSDEILPSLNGLVFTPHLERSYPEGDLAYNVLGFVSQDGLGYFGVEGKYDDLLLGDSIKLWVPEDPNLVEEFPDIPVGVDLILTIDRELQAEVEEILDTALEDTGAIAGTVVVMDPQTGEIYVMATAPRLDLNEYWNFYEVFPEATQFNSPIGRPYEPGSVFKVLTMAAALDAGAVEPDTDFLDTGIFEIGGVYLRNWNQEAWGPQDMVGCLQYSLNVCLAWVATELGPKNFYEYMLKFGIGHITGIDLDGEITGTMRLPGDPEWHISDLGTNAFGQGVSANVAQMLMAISSVANEGQMVTPRLLRAVVRNGFQYEVQTQIAGIPISPETAHTLTEMLAVSLENETPRALVDGYRLAGKSGTADIPTESGYSSSATNASFVGWGPVDDPKFLVYVWLEKPVIAPWGSVVAAPVFREVVERLVILMDIPPDELRLGMSGQ